ncbi:UDP-N-acetyl-D-mannosamine dehydrogenase [bacterium]|nr:UDP-N-acetyl-D-mannosamine dehydrogenase [bacterium]
MRKFDICVLGLGYVGLPTASIFATRGKLVNGVDISQDVVDKINNCQIDTKELDLNILLKAAVQSGNLTASIKPAKADVFIIAVPTPIEERSGSLKVPDLSYIKSAIRAIAAVVKRGDLIILESTSPVGTTEKIRDWLIEELKIQRNKSVKDTDFYFAYCPERILPGKILNELIGNDRVIGGITPQSALQAKELYECFCTAKIFIADLRVVELSKLAENSFRDLNIAFANELSMACDELSLDVWKTIELCNRHPRVNILNPGPGVGGHCIPVDPWFLVGAAPDHTKLIRTARLVNNNKREHIVAKVTREATRFKRPVIACLGLSYKANFDDLRESPALYITNAICEIPEAELVVADPYVYELPKTLQGKCELLAEKEAVKSADIVVLLVNHREFLSIKPQDLKNKIVIDTHRFWI